jgi:hypothetical protein
MKETTNRFPFVPEGWHTVTPRIVTHEAKQLVEFLKQVFASSATFAGDDQLSARNLGCFASRPRAYGGPSFIAVWPGLSTCWYAVDGASAAPLASLKSLS